MVHVPQDGHHGRPRGQVAVIFRGTLRYAHGGAGVGLGKGGTNAKGVGHQYGDLIVDDLVHGSHDAVAHQLLDDVDWVLVGQFGQMLDAERLGQDQRSGASATLFSGASGRPGS